MSEPRYVWVCGYDCEEGGLDVKAVCTTHEGAAEWLRSQVPHDCVVNVWPEEWSQSGQWWAGAATSPTTQHHAKYMSKGRDAVEQWAANVINQFAYNWTVVKMPADCDSPDRQEWAKEERDAVLASVPPPKIVCHEREPAHAQPPR